MPKQLTDIETVPLTLTPAEITTLVILLRFAAEAKIDGARYCKENLVIDVWQLRDKLIEQTERYRHTC